MDASYNDQGSPAQASGVQAIGQRPQFSRTHLESAALFARRALTIERDLDLLNLLLPLSREDAYTVGFSRDIQGDERYRDQTACVIGAIFAAVAALDATVSETFVDAHAVWIDAQEVQRAGGATSMTPLQEQLAVLWNAKRLQKAPLRQRAGAALRCVGTTEENLPSWSAASDLYDLRNLLTHYTGGVVWTYSLRPQRRLLAPHKMQVTLERHGIPPTPLGHGLVFPHSHLRHRCAAWAVETSRACLELFCAAMGCPSPLAVAETEDARRGQPSRFAVTVVSPPTI